MYIFGANLLTKRVVRIADDIRMLLTFRSLVNMNWQIQTCIAIIICIHLVSSHHDVGDFRSDFHVIGEGFHREMRLSSTSLPPSLQDCRILIKWTIPVGVYVDPYQLQNSVRNGTVHFSSHVNVEQMAHRALPLVLHSLPDLECTSSLCTFAQSLPLHSRYHLPSTDNYAKVFLPPPTSYFSCSCNSQPVKSWNKCVWQELVQSKVQGHEVQVPVGDLSHSLLVTIVTISVSFIATGYIGYVTMIK